MNVGVLQNQAYLGFYPEVVSLNATATKAYTKERKVNEKSDPVKQNSFSWSDLWNIIADLSSIIAGRKSLKGSISAVKSAYEKIKSWF